jgi:hypothetical protein
LAAELNRSSCAIHPPSNPQVHDIDGRVKATEALLRAKGYPQVVVYKEPRFADCNLFMIYGSRGKQGRRGR